jgi:glucosamine kinase
MTSIVLGLDSGGTKTDLVVVDRTGAVLVREQAEGLDPTAGDGWKDRLTTLATGLAPVGAAVLGLPYHDEIPSVTETQSSLAKALFGPNAQVRNDVAVAFEGALAGADGVLILSGTGSMAWARGPLGTFRIGGWGDVFGDEGSAYWIGSRALGLVSQHLDGRKPDAAFADAFLQWLGIGGGDLIRWTYGQTNPRAGVAGVAIGVSELASVGNPTAIALLTEAAGHLAQLGLTAARRCGAPNPLCWSFAGGVMNDPTVMAALTKAMGNPPQTPVLPPVGGAVLAAAKIAGWPVDAPFIARLKSDLSQTNAMPVTVLANSRK